MWAKVIRPLAVIGCIALGATALQAADIVFWSTPQSMTAEFSKALEALSQGKLKEADALFEAVLQSNPEMVHAALGRAQIAITERRLDEADRAVTAVLNREGSLPEAHNMKGLVLMLKKRPDEARRAFARAIELQPKYVTPRIYMAAMSRASGNREQAAADYKELTRVAPRLPAGYIGQAEAQMLMGRTAEAFKTLESWKSADPKSLTPFQVIAAVHVANGAPRQAIEELNRALKIDSHDSATLTSLGAAYAAAGDARSARIQLEAALAADSRNIEALLRLGELAVSSGESDRALDLFKTALKIDPNNPMANNNAAWVLADAGKDLNEALRLVEIATKNNPQYVDAQDTLGWIRYRRGEYAQAVTALETAKSLAPARPDIAAHLGLAYAKAGSKQKALTELRAALASKYPFSNRAELERTVAELSSSK